ncbi:hypothetical protein KPL39_10435 [Clostridium gasigenes]|nr:hypothetical protein [Clostridium gasigenes]MBU3136683.1 hypothetical protein [Clostridium gasigenes]
MSTKNNCNSCKATTSDPSSSNYSKTVKNKSNEKSPSGEDEPSTRTTYK